MKILSFQSLITIRETSSEKNNSIISNSFFTPLKMSEFGADKKCYSNSKTTKKTTKNIFELNLHFKRII